jgi:hypothetical protein
MKVASPISRKSSVMAATPEQSGWPAAVLSRTATRFAPELLYLLSGFLVLFGGHVLAQYLALTNRCTGHHFGYRLWLSNWDGQWYQYIAYCGYHCLDSGGYLHIDFGDPCS